jgi:predicted Zn-dependent protease
MGWHATSRPAVTSRRSRLKRWALLGVGLVSSVALTVGALLVLDGRQRQRDEAIRLAKAGKMTEAEAYLDAALARNPRDVELLKAQVVGYMACHRLAEAARAVSRWRALRPDDVEAHLLLIDLSLRQNRLEGAIDGSAEVLRLRPHHHELRRQRAVWLFLVGRTEEADRECRRGREGRPNDPELTQLQAEICYRLGDFTRVEALVEGLLRAQPNAAPALILRGAVYLDTGRPDQAIAPLRAALGAGGEHGGRARHYLGLALARTGQEAEAKRVLAEAKQQQAVEVWTKYGRPDSPAYKVSLAESLLELGKAEEAVRLLGEAIAQSPSCPAAHRLLAQHYQAQGQPGRAAEHKRKADD